MTWRVITRYNPNRSGMEEIATGFHLRSAVAEIANKAKAYAEIVSPDGFEGYEFQFEVSTDVVPDIPFRVRGRPMSRVSAFLTNQSRLAILVEVGSQRSEEYRILTSTLKWIEGQAGPSSSSRHRGGRAV